MLIFYYFVVFLVVSCTDTISVFVIAAEDVCGLTCYVLLSLSVIKTVF